MKKCNRAVGRYMEIEDPLHIPFFIRVHMTFCRECRSEVLKLKKIFMAMRYDSLYSSPFDMTSSIMNAIQKDRVFRKKTISGFKWVGIGGIIYISIVLINYSESFLWMKNELGPYYTISMGIVQGLALSAYSAVVIGCNYEYIKKYIDLHLKLKLK